MVSQKPILPRLAAIALLLISSMALVSACSRRSSHKADPPKPVSPQFSLTLADLRQMTESMPESVRQSIISKPVTFLDSMAAILHQPAIYLALVDKQHALPTGYTPPDLVKLTDYGFSVSRSSLELRRSIMPEATAMVKAARTDHVVLLFSSTYRSYETQKVVYAREVRLYGKKVADSESAVPGHSQHQMGTTIDFGCICNDFDKTAAFKWLTENGWKYGFSMTYPKGFEKLTGYRYEPWHWHYITKAGTAAQREFFDDIQQYLLLFLNDNRTQLVSSYRGGTLGPGWTSS